jgi:hypothetical protein
MVTRRRLLQYGAFGLAAPAFAPALASSRSAAQPEDARASEIVRCAIHPAIGVARVGNSPDGWFLAPETAGPFPVPPGGFKDAEGRIKRQVARFRLYGLDADGRVVREVTAADPETDIAWTVHLANAKAAWYEFDEALDIPAAKGEPPAPLQPAPAPLRSARRNATIVERDRLVIDPGRRTIRGRRANANGTDRAARLDGGSFLGIEVELGELRTDEDGRLLVFGGWGRSCRGRAGAARQHLRQQRPLARRHRRRPGRRRRPHRRPRDPRRRCLGRRRAAELRARDLRRRHHVRRRLRGAIRLAPELAPERPSFCRQIYPLFERMVGNQWVNAGFLREVGWGSGGDFWSRRRWPSSPTPARGAASSASRCSPASATPPTWRWTPPPCLPTTATASSCRPPTPRQWMAVLESQYGWLRQWAAGDFDADWPATGLRFPDRLEDLPVAEQPAALDRAALDDCLGGPFHPGCEMTWPMRHASIYAEPFRLRRRTEPEPDWGEFLTSLTALGPDGPLTASGPGRRHTLDGGAVADRHLQLPVPLRRGGRRLPAHLLAGAGAERRAGAGGVRLRA